jgi:hypothetical protein
MRSGKRGGKQLNKKTVLIEVTNSPIGTEVNP